MLFTELRFLLFFLVAFAVHWSLRRSTHRKLWLLICSYAFYSFWNWRFSGLILASTLVDYGVGFGLSRVSGPSKRRLLLGLSLLCNLGLLSLFKYLNFFGESASELASSLGFELSWTTLNITLPVGISFYTFQTLSYTIDVYRGKLAPVRSFLDFATFVAFFPQLVAGPIVRAADFLPQLASRRVFAAIPVRPMLVLFLFGFIKKAVLADNLGLWVDPVFADPELYGAQGKWLAAVLYSIQIYGDFSGYSDMAIACAGLLGYQLKLNFDSPFVARSITEIWHRWHMSLSTWFRDYLYIPLGGSRSGALRTSLILFLVFTISGLWHGAAWHFVIWGAIHGLVILIERSFGGRLPKGLRPLGHAYTLLVFVLAFVFFRAQDASQAAAFIGDLWWSDTGAELLPTQQLWWLAVAAFAVAHVAMFKGWGHAWFMRRSDWFFSATYGLAWAMVLPFAAAHHQPFIYFQF